MAWRRCRRSVARMSKLSLTSRSDATRQTAIVLLGAAAINAVVFSPLGDQGFVAIALLGPPLTGFVAALRGKNVWLVAAAWAVSGLFWFVFDWILNNEDKGFHLMLTALMVALTGLGAQLARLLVAIARKLTGHSTATAGR
jgi:preprotein translocase subunit SecE